MVTSLIERMKGEHKITNETAIDNICKKLASQEASKMIVKIRNNKTHRDLPSKAFCRNFFDSFPSTYISRNLYKNKKVTFESSDEKTIDNNNADIEEEEAAEVDPLVAEKKATVKQLTNKIHSIYSSLVNEAYQKAFDALHTLPTPPEENISSNSTDLLDVELNALYAKQHELIGTDFYLRCKLDNAANSYRKAIQFSPNTTLEAKLKLATIHLEIGQISEVIVLINYNLKYK
jgi:alpha-galactosidase